MEPRRSKHFLAHIPTIALLVVFAMSPWLGVLFFVLRAIDRDAEKKEQENAEYSSDFRSQDTGAGQPARDTEPVYGHDVPTAEQQNAKKWHKTLTNLCTIMGAVFLFAGVTNAVDVISVWKFWPDPGELFSDIAMAIGGGGALLTGLRMKSTRKLERLLDKVVGERDNISLPELFAAAGVDAARGRAAVESAIDHGYFGADAYIDNRTGTLVVRGAAPQPPRPAEPAPAPAPEDQYAALQRQLRQANDAIPDPVMTAKISRLEDVSARIFALAKKDPDKKAQLQKFMDYYLPTALKLLNTYAQLSAQDVQGTNITEAKQSIERSMDLLITAFENQLDKLFASDALDVSTDIAALEGMLNLDGLTGGDFAPRS
ncbi:5-bromo-4-chloroindolyl phosphate hydrolysis family protein [Faecalibacterium prausnitzii]|uniref:5-bromo-4-chloroindolyl phosphate hydrolysis family protein n=1 Tax=Faecalibacterium prausnitzii TaxID=853 RepID=UPI0012DDAD47|nr:5-bromo-4-chloroindolyl phosphate hydrolysis family protein [Faecalibacterium prausnitzii]